MKKLLWLLILCTLPCWQVRANNVGFAVVELFTSEGCSSCPPADALLAKVQQQCKALPVFILAYHVDYWNRLGWTDIFSDAAYSERQRQYSIWLNQQVYTPQVVVNGSVAFVGSDALMLRDRIRQALKQPAAASISISAKGAETGTISLKFELANKKADRLMLALVQKQAVSNVASGENKGRQLAHVQLVRSFKVLAAGATGQAELKIPDGLHTKDIEVIAFQQDSKTGNIIAACKLANL